MESGRNCRLNNDLFKLNVRPVCAKFFVASEAIVDKKLQKKIYRDLVKLVSEYLVSNGYLNNISNKLSPSCDGQYFYLYLDSARDSSLDNPLSGLE